MIGYGENVRTDSGVVSLTGFGGWFCLSFGKPGTTGYAAINVSPAEWAAIRAMFDSVESCAPQGNQPAQ